MATRFELALYGEDPARLRAAGEEALEEIARLETQLSFYRSESELHWINARAAAGPVKVEPRLFRLLQLCVTLGEQTEGAFDITIAPLMRVWGFAGGAGRQPEPAEIEAARAVIGRHHLLLDEERFEVRYDRPGVEMDLGAIGKGYAIERAAEMLREAGVTAALLHGGTSSLYAIGAPPGESAWRVGIRHPSSSKQNAVMELRDSSLSVSAVHGKCFKEGDREFGHVLDPRTGWPAEGPKTAAVAGPSPTIGDALSTALLVLGEAGLDRLRSRFPGYSGMVAHKDGWRQIE